MFLTGAADPQVAAGCASDEVLFLEFSSKAVRGLKLGAIRALRRIAAERNFAFCIAHRFKPIYVALLGTGLPVIGVHHAFGDYERKGRRIFANLFSKRLSLLGVSDAVRDDMRRCLPQWPAERIQTLYNRIDIDALQAALVPRAEARQALGLDAQAWIVGNVGRLHPTRTRPPCCVALPKRYRGCRLAPAWQSLARAPGSQAQGPGRRAGHCRASGLPWPGAGCAPLLPGIRRIRPELRP